MPGVEKTIAKTVKEKARYNHNSGKSHRHRQCEDDD